MKRKTAAMTFKATLLTLFPEMFPGPLGHSLSGKALAKGVWQLDTRNIRDVTTDVHKTVDDTPFGGGAGMVMKPDVLEKSYLTVEKPHRFLYMSPRGRLLTQSFVKELAAENHIVILCGRYEGVDQRFLDAHDAEEVSVGDYVLSGGEMAALTLLDACVRLLPGVMGNAQTTDEESFESGLLEYPHYTRPSSWTDAHGVTRDVPDVLLSGHHGNVAKWRHAESVKITQARRPDLIKDQ